MRIILALLALSAVCRADFDDLYSWGKEPKTVAELKAIARKTDRPSVTFVGLPKRSLPMFDSFTSPRYAEGGKGISVITPNGQQFDLEPTATDDEIREVAYPKQLKAEVREEPVPFVSGPTWNQGTPVIIAPSAEPINTSYYGSTPTVRTRIGARFAGIRGGISIGACVGGG